MIRLALLALAAAWAQAAPSSALLEARQETPPYGCDEVAQNFVEHVYDRDYAALDSAAKGGDAFASLLAGQLNLELIGAARNEALADVWFDSALTAAWAAALSGDARGQYVVGRLYGMGKAVAKDEAAAASWMRKAAEQGFAPAQHCLGAKYAAGQGVPRDDREALFWYRKAAEQGDVQGRFDLGLMYLDGRGVPADEEEALSWFGKADGVKWGDPRARHLLMAARADRRLPDAARVLESGDPLYAVFAWFGWAAEQRETRRWRLSFWAALFVGLVFLAWLAVRFARRRTK